MITIVSGLPRSGTSMMMQMLEAGGFPILTDGRRLADDSNVRGYYEYEPVKRLLQDQSWLTESQGKVVKIVSIFLEQLPPELTYRIIFMERDLDATLRSQQSMLTSLNANPQAADQGVLKKVFEKQVEKSKSWMETQAHIEFLTIKYEAALSNPLEVAQEVVRFLGQGNPDAMAGVIDPTLCHQ